MPDLAPPADGGADSAEACKDTPALYNKDCTQSLCRALVMQEVLYHCIVCCVDAKCRTDLM